MGRTNYRNVAYVGISPFFFESGRMKQSKVLGKDGTQVIAGKLHIQHAITVACWSRVPWWLSEHFLRHCICYDLHLPYWDESYILRKHFDSSAKDGDDVHD
jgi:hypothetical protein